MDQIKLTVEAFANVFTKTASNRSFIGVNALAAEVEEHLVAKVVKTQVFQWDRLWVEFDSCEIEAEGGEPDGRLTDVEPRELCI